MTFRIGLQLLRILSCNPSCEILKSRGGKLKNFVLCRSVAKPCFNNSTFFYRTPANIKANAHFCPISHNGIQKCLAPKSHILSSPDSNPYEHHTGKNVLALEALEARLRAILPEQYRNSYETLCPVSHGLGRIENMMPRGRGSMGSDLGIVFATSPWAGGPPASRHVTTAGQCRSGLCKS